MMYAKLALENVKKSTKDYLIYIVTLTACISMFYAFLSISSNYYDPNIGAEFNLDILGDGIKYAILLITVLLMFLMQYVNHFMIQRRKREFAIQSIIGMEQSTIARLFFVESLIMGIFSLIVGIGLGGVFSQFITAMLLQMYHKPFEFSFMLFPDTIILTILFFCICFATVGLSQVRTIRKIKIIDMLNADRKNDILGTPHKWIYKLFPVNFVLYLLITFYNIRTLSYYFNGEFELVIKIWSAISIIVPILMLITHIRERFRRKEQNTVKQLFLIECIGLLELIILSILPVFKVYLAMPMDKGAFNVYMGFLFWCVVFGVSVFFVLFSNYLLVIKERQKYKEENLFFFGQLLSKLKSKTLSMTLICLTLTLSMALFFVTPLLVGWAQGFLEKRVPFDIQISSDYIGMQSGYIGIQSEKELPVTDYSFLDSFIEKNISVRDDCSFKTYFVNKTDFYNQLENSRKNASPITAISLSDYNHLLKMAGYDEISLRDHEFTTQWLSITPQDSISAYLEAHKSIKTDGGDLQLADISAHTVDLGEDFYNFQSVIYIVPDHICNKLTSANTFRYMMADKTISYDIAQELKSYFENSSLTDSLVTYNITMRTIEVNDNSAIIFIMQTGLTYSAIILFVTCFTILALQQLSDSGKYKYRFRVLRNMGVEEPHIRKLILKQLAVWFGVPVILALILSGAFLVFLLVGFHMQIAVYIGVQRFVCASSDEEKVLYFAREKKGHEGVKGTVTEDFRGILVHDHEITFYRYGSAHQECLAHVERYLKDSMENESSLTWNRRMRELLQRMIHYRKEHTGEASLDAQTVAGFETEYQEILDKAKEEYKRNEPSPYYREGYNLYRRMQEYKTEHLLFLHDMRVPTTNNTAERCLRDYKRKQTFAMTFRSLESIEELCHSKGVLLEVRKNNPNIYTAVMEIFNRRYGA